VLAIDQPQVRLVDQGGGLERLARLLLGQTPGGEFSQLVVNQGQELRGGVGIAVLNGTKDVGDFAQRRPHFARDTQASPAAQRFWQERVSDATMKRPPTTPS
jgi:hypothetical protein